MPEGHGAVLADDGDSLVHLGALGAGELVMSPLIRPMSRRIGVISSSAGWRRRGPLVDAVDGGGEPFPGAQQVIEVGGQVGEVGDVGAEVVAPAQRNRTGQAPPPACTFDGSVQRP